MKTAGEDLFVITGSGGPPIVTEHADSIAVICQVAHGNGYRDMMVRRYKRTPDLLFEFTGSTSVTIIENDKTVTAVIN